MMVRVTDPNLAQAHVLITALRDQLNDMEPKLARAEAECEEAGRHTNRARALRLQAATLRSDISQAQFLIARLRRRFPGMDTTTPASVAADYRAPGAALAGHGHGGVATTDQRQRRHEWTVSDVRRAVVG
jgi:hypothetical protein